MSTNPEWIRRALILRLMMLLYNDAVFGGNPKTPQGAPRLREDLSLRVYADGQCYVVRLEVGDE